MREQEPTTVVSDAELVADLRAGNRRAMAELYTRHSADAVRVGRIVCRDGDADELVAEAFARVFTKIVDGGGPTEHFRAYLHTVIRNVNIERSRQTSREQPVSDKLWLLDTAAEEDGEEVDDVDADHAARALQSLPENWQLLLWKLEVQGSKPAEVAAELSVPVATISDTAYRAREGLRLAYLSQHLPAADNRRCDWTRERLSRLARGGLSQRASGKVRDHLGGCVECAALYDELHQLNTRLGAAIWPIVLVGGITLGGVAGTGSIEPATPSGAQGQPSSAASSGAGTSTLSFATLTPLTTIAAVVVTTLVAAIAATGIWLLRDDNSPRRSASPPQESAPTQLLSPPSEGPVPGSVRDPSDGIQPIAAVLPLPHPALTGQQDDQTGAGPGRTEAGPRERPAPTPPAEPGTEPTEEPAAEPEPVDLKAGEPTIEAADEPYRWLLTVPILATEGAAATGFTIDLELSVSEPTGFIERLSPGWDCGPIEDGGTNGDPYFFGEDVPVTCHYTYEPGQTVKPLQLILESITTPTGAVTVGGSSNADPDPSNNHREF